MVVFEDAWGREDLPRDAVVTIGNFDGLHRGQQALLDSVRRRAETLATSSLVLTFEPHPLALLDPEKAPQRLTTPAQKLDRLGTLGVDAVGVLEFDGSLCRTGAKEFIHSFLGGRLGAREVHVGSRFSFGRDREGTLAMLVEEGPSAGFAAIGVKELLHEGEPISSTRIRSLVADGAVEAANDLLGRSYSVQGVVAPGESRGRNLGFPTANLAVENELFPRNGVYVTELQVRGERSRHPSVTNVGTRPTFEDDERCQIETHVMDFEEDLYGEQVELSFCRRLRGERKFESVTELVEQIGIDVGTAREYFATCAC